MFTMDCKGFKGLFFDRQRITAALNKARRRALGRAGACVRTVAKRSIRKRKKSSAPGQPPSSHEGSLRQLIYFGYDARADTYVVGPIGFKKSEAPHALEHGGQATITKYRKGKKVKKRITIKPRPFMGPALEKGEDRLVRGWANSIKG